MKPTDFSLEAATGRLASDQEIRVLERTIQSVLKDCRREVDQARELVLWNHSEADGSTYHATKISRHQTPAIQSLLALRDEYDALKKESPSAETMAEHAKQRRMALGELHRGVVALSKIAIDRAVVAKDVLVDIAKLEQRDRHHRNLMKLAHTRLSGQPTKTIEGLTSAELDGLLKGGEA